VPVGGHEGEEPGDRGPAADLELFERHVQDGVLAQGAGQGPNTTA